jgi:prepilin-type processing-associated H-X9-DG protein
MNLIAKCTKIDLAVTTLCTAFLLLCLGAVSQTGRERAKNIICQNNLRQLGLAQNAYLGDYSDRFPSAWNWLVRTESPAPGYQRYCRWHDPRYPPDGPLWSYLAKERIVLCPTFNDLASRYGSQHPAHVPSVPIEPQYGYSMNAFLGVGNWGANHGGGALKLSDVTRSKSEVFFFAEENMWIRPGNNNVLNDNALCADGTDWFGTFHNTPDGDLNGGTINAVFVDGHAQVVRSGLRVNGTAPDYSEAEYGHYEKYSWPNATPPVN